MTSWVDHTRTWADVEVAAKGADPTLARQAQQGLESALHAAYEAAAFDIDGTVTARGRVLLDIEVADRIRALLRRGVNILLITGRGGSAATAVRQILHIVEEDRLSQRYTSRLTCLIDNGSAEIRIVPGASLTLTVVDRHLIRNVSEVRELAAQALRLEGLDPSIAVRPARIRLEFDDVGDRDHGRELIEELQDLEPDLLGPLCIASGEYRGNVFTIDITPTTKGRAIDEICAELGIDRSRCVRFADQGHEHGNDFDLLDHVAGFSVERVSSAVGRCHPIVDTGGQTLQGPQATKFLLDHLYFAPQLATRRRTREAVLNNLATFERDVRHAAHREIRRTEDDFARSIGALYSHEQEILGAPDLARAVYDYASGAVRMSHSEAMSPAAREPLGRLFELQRFDFSETPPGARYSMYSDTAILLRGPEYYADWTKEWKSTGYPVQRILEDYQRFVGAVLGGVAFQSEAEPSLVRIKLLLAATDNVRDALLKVLHFAYAVDSEVDYGPELQLIDRVSDVVEQFVDVHVSMHVGNRLGWVELHDEVFDVLERAYDLFGRVRDELRAEGIDWASSELKLFRSRECDSVIEAIAGMRIGLEKHVEQHRASGAHTFGVVGLVYGAIELPFVAAAVGKQINVEVIPGLIAISSYTRRDLDGEPTALGLMEPSLNLWLSDQAAGRSAKILLADDNMTTARSLQRARDGLALDGYDVVGAVVIRYPGLNRFVQMYDIDRSVPDPDVFLTFVRGLVAPAPYARRVAGRPGSSNPYLDVHGIFRKSDERILRHLAKSAPEDVVQ